MARAVVVALWWAVAASATRYLDYSGVKMPLYGGGTDYEGNRDFSRAALADDYRGHSPDAPAALDYKYEEELNGKSEKPLEDIHDLEAWHKPSRKQRELVRHDDKEDVGRGDKYSTEGDAGPKYRSSNRFPKHRSRLKLKNPLRDHLSHRHSRYGRDRIDDVGDDDTKEYFNIDRVEFRDDKSTDFDDDINHLVHTTTERLSRKKPIDRFIKPRTQSDHLEMEHDDIEPGRRIKNDMKKDLDYATNTNTGWRRPSDRRHERYRPVFDDDDMPDSRPRRPSGKVKHYEDYSDYYDMKRVGNIKNKLPLLLRRTTARVAAPTPTLDPDLYDVLWTDQRTVSSPSITTGTMTTITTTTATSTTPPTSTATVEWSTTTTLMVTVSTPTPTHNTSRELSLAEKSRLSILKKSMKKESVKSEFATKKPPVLLQVTNKLHTVVMVEPPSSQQPWMRAREVSGDTPERLEKVKQLMRHKLVANAKSIQDLTDNWDDLVCDYIDVSLIDHAASTHRINWFLLFLNSIILFA